MNVNKQEEYGRSLIFDIELENAILIKSQRSYVLLYLIIDKHGI